MAERGFVRKFPPLNILSEENVQDIKSSTLAVLKETGVKFQSTRALKIFKKNDCIVDYDNMRVRFPESLVQECIHRCPSSFLVKARDPNKNLIIGGNHVHFMCGIGKQMVDLDTWEPRTPTRKEHYDAVAVLDALENIDMLGPYAPYFGFEGIESKYMILPEVLAAKLRNSDKFVKYGYTADSEIFAIKMAKALEIDIATGIHPTMPLAYSEVAINNGFRAAEAGFPIMVHCGISGIDNPVTVAGGIVGSDATGLSALVFIQLISPGNRIWVNATGIPLDMSSGELDFGSIFSSLNAAAHNQVIRSYCLPIRNSAPYLSSSKKIDYQCGYEKTQAAYICAISGGNILIFQGGVNGELTFHPIQAIIDDDIAGNIGRFISGVNVNKETLALDLINEVGPAPGHYLDKEHTRQWWKYEGYLTKASDKMNYKEWIKSGKKDCIDYAKEIMDKILEEHKVDVPITNKQETEIESILSEAREFYKKREAGI